jgi:large conductance mechanosensitive channel
VAIRFGNTIAVVVDFVIIAFAVFCMVKAINGMHKKKEEEPAPPPAEPEPSAEEKLLTEIRDLLKNK